MNTEITDTATDTATEMTFAVLTPHWRPRIIPAGIPEPAEGRRWARVGTYGEKEADKMNSNVSEWCDNDPHLDPFFGPPAIEGPEGWVCCVLREGPNVTAAKDASPGPARTWGRRRLYVDADGGLWGEVAARRPSRFVPDEWFGIPHCGFILRTRKGDDGEYRTRLSHPGLMKPGVHPALLQGMHYSWMKSYGFTAADIRALILGEEVVVVD